MTKGQIESKISEAISKFALFEKSRENLEQAITSVVDCQVISTHSDVSTRTGEKMIMIVVDRNLEEHI